MDNAIKASSATAMASGEKVILQIVAAENSAIFCFEIPEPLITLEALRHAESEARAMRINNRLEAVGLRKTRGGLQ